MFKMGCSMAKKILAIDKQSSNHDHGASGSGLDLGSGSSSTSNKKSKEKHHQDCATGAGAPNQASAGANKVKTNTEELGDFSKLEQDPRIPLNIRQIFKITKSWKAIARTMSKTGTAMFLNLFEQNQDLFYLFDRFQHLKGKELHESMELREHASTVMSTLDQSINSLSDYDNFVTYLHSIGKLHRKVPGFKRAHFWKIEQPFLKAVKQTLDERCNETIEEIYKIAIKLIIETIADGYGEDDLTASTNENKDSTSPSGSNNNNSNNDSGNAENSRNISGAGSAGDTVKAGGNSGSANTTNSGNRQHLRQQKMPFGGQNKACLAIAVGEDGEDIKEELKSNASRFVNSLCSSKRKLFNRNRKQNKPTNKRRRKSESSSSCCRIEMNGNVRLMNLQEKEKKKVEVNEEEEEEELNKIENQIHLKQSRTKQVVLAAAAAINKQHKDVEKEKQEMKQNEFEMRSNCSTHSSKSFNDLVEKAYTRRESQQDAPRLNNRRNDDDDDDVDEEEEEDENNNQRLHKQANEERLNETLLVLKELLLSLMAKKGDDKRNSKELNDSEEQQPKKAVLVNGAEIEPLPTNECENSFNKHNTSNGNNNYNNILVESRDDTTTNGGGKQVELLNEIADSFEREEKNGLSSERARTECLLEEDLVKEDNKGENSCCKYKENFANNNNNESCYSNTTSIDHTLKVCEASCRFNHFDDDDDDGDDDGDLEQENKQDTIRGVNSLEKQVTCSRQVDQQQTIPSSVRSKTKLDKVQVVVKGEEFVDEDRDGDESDTLKRLNVEEKSADDSLDRGLDSKVILDSNCPPSRIHWRESENESESEAATATKTEFCSQKKAKISLENEKRGKNKIACEVKTKQVSVRGTLEEGNDSENVNYIGVAKEEEHDKAPRALFPLFPASSEAAPHSKFSFNLALSRCHSKNIKCYVNGGGGDNVDNEKDATANNHLHNATPPKSSETTTTTTTTTTTATTATTKFYDSSIWCSKLSAARRNIVRTLKITKVTRSKQPPHNSLDNELPQSNIAANSRQPISRSNLSSKTVTKTGKTTTATNLEADVNENSTHPRWQPGMLVCSLAKRITTTKRPTLYNFYERMLPSRQQQQRQKLPLVINNQTRVEKEEVEESDFGLAKEIEYKQSSKKQTQPKFHLFSDKRTTKSFLIPSLWSPSSSLQSFFGIKMGKRNRKRQQMRKQTNNYYYHHHHQRQQPDVSLETLERSSLEYNGEQSSESKGQIELTSTTSAAPTTTPTNATKTTVRTEPFKLGKSSLLTTDLSDLSELIKMLMLTITSKKYQHSIKQTGINSYIDNNDIIN